MFTEGPFQRVVDVFFPDDGESGDFRPGTIRYATKAPAGLSEYTSPQEIFWQFQYFWQFTWMRPYGNPTGAYTWVTTYFDWYPVILGGNSAGGYEMLSYVGTPTSPEEVSAGVTPVVYWRETTPVSVGYGKYGYGWSGLTSKVDYEERNYYPATKTEVVVGSTTFVCDYSVFTMKIGGQRFRPIGFTSEFSTGDGGVVIPMMELEEIA